MVSTTRDDRSGVSIAPPTRTPAAPPYMSSLKGCFYQASRRPHAQSMQRDIYVQDRTISAILDVKAYTSARHRYPKAYMLVKACEQMRTTIPTRSPRASGERNNANAKKASITSPYLHELLAAPTRYRWRSVAIQGKGAP